VLNLNSLACNASLSTRYVCDNEGALEDLKCKSNNGIKLVSMDDVDVQTKRVSSLSGLRP
jgi:hypothetical protein